MSNLPQKRIERTYTEAEKQRALTTLAACNGVTRAAERALAEDGLPISHQTLSEWRRAHEEDYRTIRAEMLPKIREGAAEDQRALERRKLAIAHEASELIASRLPHMQDRDLINAGHQSTIDAAVASDKARLDEGMPTAIIHRSSDEVLRDLAVAMGVETIEGEAEEVAAAAAVVPAQSPDSSQ